MIDRSTKSARHIIFFVLRFFLFRFPPNRILLRTKMNVSFAPPLVSSGTEGTFEAW